MSRTKTAQTPPDRIVPLHFFDDGPLWRAFILYSMFVFDGVLDAEKLRSSLEQLTRREGWWKLGARLRQSRSETLEYHIPSSFSAERPSLAYSHIKHDMPAAEHPQAARIPRASKIPSVVGNPDDLPGLMRPEGGPLKLGDYINTDRPQLGLHIVSFTDTTLVTIHWPHTMCDAMGKKTILDAWTLVLEGREDEVQAPHGMEFDPFSKLGVNPPEPHKLVPQQLGMFGLLGFGVGLVPTVLRQQETRMVCVPRSFVERLRKDAIAQLAVADNASEPPFLSENDVLFAWWTKLAIAHLPQNSTRTVNLNNAFDMRKRLKPDIFPEGATYLSNGVSFINVLLKVKDIADKPVSYTASAIRKSINELGTREQVEAFQGLVRQGPGKLPPFFGDRNMHLLTYSNWTKADLFSLDFSAARRDAGDALRRTACKPRYIQNNHFGQTMPNAFPIIGKDNDGNYWLSGYMNKGHWARIEELLAKET
ncbi:hypothetical protein K491DRAFT_696469 [Lophiostoma macrostomum CBS 122681]|uniref:LysR family regulatory protein n=1 Tax=Lophiostoma macrostomum CBS 122681 TaxID=1314788 RepID=A0A6A6SUZ7_9PLEO|nr:hypothetical protein K491DRAFT_696469 [Lophiostoma macrostomum CBS 122681]